MFTMDTEESNELEDVTEASDFPDDVLEVVDIDKLPPVLQIDETLDDEIEVFKMTSLGTFMLLGRTISSSTLNDVPHDDDSLHRLSLAYERLHAMPKLILQELAPDIRILDISNNEFDCLDFMTEFKEITSLICDHNNITSKTNIPYMPNLELLWLNHCKIKELYPWARKLQQACPNLRYLSLMGNPAAPSYLNGGNFYEYLQYRLFIISLFPKLQHLDDRLITEDQRKEAERMYHQPLVERLVLKSPTFMPSYFKTVTEKFSGMVTSTPNFTSQQKNCII